MSCISFNITVVVDVFTEILIYRLRSSFVKGGEKAPPSPKNDLLQTETHIVVKTVDRATYI